MTLKEIAENVLAADALCALVATEDTGTTQGAIKGWETRRRGVNVDAEEFDSALNRITEDGVVDIRFKNPDEKTALLSAAKDFHSKYGQMQIPLPIGRKMFFAPSEQSVLRHNGDVATAWAEYALHAVSNDAVDDSGKHYRVFNQEKVDKVIPRIREIVDADQTTIVRDSKVAYHLQLDDKHFARLVARPEFGNLRVDDLVEVTTIYTRGKVPSASKPLSRAIEEWKAGGEPSLNSTT